MLQMEMPISKFDLLSLIKEKFKLTILNLKQVPGKKSDKSLKQIIIILMSNL